MHRGSTASVGIVALLVLTITLAAGLALSVEAEVSTGPPTAHLELLVDADADRVSILHQAGDPIRVRDVTMEIVVEETDLAHQPPIPFFAAEGFRSGPTGPFNVATRGTWSAGEMASLRIAGTNTPSIEPGDRVEVTLRTDRGLISHLSTRAT